MRVLHVTTTDPGGGGGGVARAVKCLSEGYDLRFYNASGLWGLVKAFVLALRLLRAKYDIIHFHDSVAAYFYLKLGGSAKTAYTSHGHWTTFFQAVPPKGGLGKTKAKLLMHFQNYTCSNADVVAAVSNSIKSAVEENSKPKRIVTIYNGVDTRAFRPLGLKREGAIWVGKDAIRKRLDKTIEYCRKNKLKLVVVGIDKIPFDTSGVETETYRDVSDEMLARLYNRAKILPFFSGQEGHPLVVLEAMACGCDVLAAESANAEILPLKNGFYRASGRLARNIAIKNDWKNIRQQYEGLYREMVA